MTATADYGAVPSERERAVFGIWRRVNEIAVSTEDMTAIRNLLAEAHIQAGAHVGADPTSFTPLMVAEWVLGQWVDMIDNGSPFLNSARNISLHQWEKVTGLPAPEWKVEGPGLHLDEVRAINERIGANGSTEGDARG